MPGRRPNSGVRAVHTVKSFPPPVGGLNFAAPINGMAATDAILLDNYICSRFGLTIRRGWAEHAVAIAGGSVRSLLPWTGADSASDALFAVTDAGVYDVTASVTAPVVAHALSGTGGAGKVQSINFSAAGQNYLAACSEVDGYFRYSLSAGWGTVASGVGAGQVSGADPADLVQVCSWKNRLWFVERDSANVWYLPVLAVAGVAQKLDVGPFLSKGGHVTAAASWTMDAGVGIDDHLVILGSEGDVLVYKGTDPASSSTFSIVGTWNIGAMPEGRRNFTQSSGDLMIVSEYGLSPTSYLIKGGQTGVEADPNNFVSRIQEVLRQDVGVAMDAEGWAVISHPTSALVIINSPAPAGGAQKQYVLDTHSLRWSTFSNIPAVCMVSYKRKLYFGTVNGRVCEALIGELDNVSLGLGQATGTYVECRLQAAFNYFEKPGQLKRWLMVRPTFVGSTRPGVLVAMNGDFDTQFPSGIPPYFHRTGSLWGSAVWAVGRWFGSSQTYQFWQDIRGASYAGSLNMVVVAPGGTRLSSIDYMYEGGGVM